MSDYASARRPLHSSGCCPQSPRFIRAGERKRKEKLRSFTKAKPMPFYWTPESLRANSIIPKSCLVFFSIPAGWWWGGCLRNRFLFTGAKPEIRRALGALWCVQNKRRLDYFWHAALCKCGRVTFTRALHALSPVLHDIFTHVVMSLTAHYDCTDQDRYLSPHA